MLQIPACGSVPYTRRSAMLNAACRVALSLLLCDHTAALRLPPATTGTRSSPIDRRQFCISAFSGALAVGAVPRSLRAADEPLSASTMLTVGQYLNDLREARRGCERVAPYLEQNDENGYEAARRELRKPPISGIRKAASKALKELNDGTSLKGLKEKQYEGIKAALGADEVAVSLDELEQKMRHHEQTVFMLSEYIDTKGAETAFEPIAEECHATIALINAETIRVLAEQPVFAPMAY